MLYNQTFNLDQVSFAAEGLKDAQQTVMHLSLSLLAIDTERDDCGQHVVSSRKQRGTIL